MNIPSLRKLYPRKLWQQIFLILLGLVVVPLVVTGTVLIHSGQKALQSNVENSLRQVIEHSTGEVLKEYEGTSKAIVVTAAILESLSSDPWAQETALVELSLRFPAFRFVSIVDMQGNERVTSQLGSPLRTHLESETLRCAMGGSLCHGQVRFASDHSPVMELAVPIHRLGRVHAVLLAEYSLRGIWDVVDHIQIGSGGKVFLMDQNGRIIAHPDKKKVFLNTDLPYPEVIKDLNLGIAASRVEQDKANEKWMVVYAPIKTLGWGLVAAQPAHQAFAFIEILSVNSWILLILILSACVFIALLLANRMSRPVELLMAATHRIARGDLEVALPIRRRDEMGRLMFAFNSMILQLKRARHVEKLSIVGRSASMIAHELKNSLTLVKTFVQLMPIRSGEPRFVKESAETILRELDAWNAMLRNMMDFAKNPLPLSLSVVNANRLIEDLTAVIKLRAEDCKMHFQIQLAESLPAIEVDVDRLKQVLINLINNAIEASKAGDRIIISTVYKNSEFGGHIEIGVTNSGKVIAEDNLNKVFDPFFSTKENGLGLGLSICRDIIHRHGGRIDVLSEMGKGTVFTIKLPVYLSRGKEQRGSYDFRENRRY